MKFVVAGKVLNIHSGKSKSGKDYVIADIYDGTDLVKVFGVDTLSVHVGDEVMLPCRLDINWDERRTFLMAVK